MIRSPPQSQRPISPANTTFSGISNYRSDSYRALPPGGKGAPSVPPIDGRIIARTHFEELTGFLESHVLRENQASRSSAREKLTRLTIQQFQELSTDVYDELMRRKNNSSRNEVPFLPVREDFHPKRNQARQKLATLPQPRFKDLSSDVYFELGRRYPEFKEAEGLVPPITPGSPSSAYDDSNPPTAASNAFSPTQSPPPPLPSSDPYSPEQGLSSRRRGPYSSRPNSPPTFIGDPPPSSYNSRKNTLDDNASSTGPINPYTRRPSQDTTASSQQQSQRSASIRRPSRSASERENREREKERVLDRSASVREPITSPGLPAAAKASVVIPNKSTMAEEDPIEVPFGETPVDKEEEERDEEESEYGRSPRSADTGAGLASLGARLNQQSQPQPSQSVEEARSDTDYFDRMSFGSAPGHSRTPSRVGEREKDREREELKKDYEFKIATLQKKNGAGEERVRLLEGELESLRERMEDQSSSMLDLQRQLDTLKRKESEEVEMWIQKYNQAEEDRQKLLEAEGGQGSEEQEQLIDQLRNDLQSLLVELAELQARNDEFTATKEINEVRVQEAEEQVREWKRKYEAAKTELRGVKATSALYVQAPDLEDASGVPLSLDGGVLDVHLTAFQSSIDAVLTTARSSAPQRVLGPMKNVVEAVSAILSSLRNHSSFHTEPVRNLHDRLEDTLSNLVTAAKNHAQSYGISPVSLLDAAASHVSDTVVNIVRHVKVRKASKIELENFQNGGGATATVVKSPTFSPLNNLASPPLGGFNGLSSPSSKGWGLDSSLGFGNPNAKKKTGPFGSGAVTPKTSSRHRRVPSEPSSSNGSASPPMIFDTPLATATTANNTDESATTEGEDAWGELRMYLEAQSDQLVHSIQSTLSLVRSPVPPPALDEHLTQVITIVSSIVAVFKDSHIPDSNNKVGPLIADLSEHVDKLSELQGLEKTGANRNQLAKSSFQIANALKMLLKI